MHYLQIDAFILRQTTSRDATSDSKTPYILVAVGFALSFIVLTCGIFRIRLFERALRRDNEQLQIFDVAAPQPMCLGPPPIEKFKVPFEALEEPCPICLEPLEVDNATEGHCHHPIHSHCLDQWLTRDRHRSCPVCRSTFHLKSYNKSSPPENASLTASVNRMSERNSSSASYHNAASTEQPSVATNA